MVKAVKMPSETDVAPKAICGMDWDWIGLEISRRGYAKSTFGANNNVQNFV